MTAAAGRWHAALPAHARPRELEVRKDLPVLPGGKIDRSTATRIPRAAVRYP